MTGHPTRLSVAVTVAGLALAAVLAVSLGFPARLLPLVRSAQVEHRLDGRAEPGEYRFRWSDEASGVSLAWSIVGDRLLGALSTPDTGWVAVGFGATGPLMYGSDIIIGFVDARGAHLRDHFASEPTNHLPDTAVGGHDDVLAGAGTQTDAGTTIEFERALIARDSTDRAIAAGETHVMVASADADDYTAYHSGGRKAVTLVDLFAGPPAAAQGSILPDHLSDVQIFLGAWAALLLALGIHGLGAAWAERRASPAEIASGGGPSPAGIAVLLVLDLAAFVAFGGGILLAAPVWLLGLALAVGLLALSGLIIVYSRAVVSFELSRHERDDGIPW